jgi:hypothetical protein
MPKRQALPEVLVAGGRSEEGRCACAGSLPPMLAAKTGQRTEAVVGGVGIAASLVWARQLGTLRTRDLGDLHSGLRTGSLARVRLERQDGLVGGFGRAVSAV